MRTIATVTAEEVVTFGSGTGTRPALRLVMHDETGKRPRTAKEKRGHLIVAREGETLADLFVKLGEYTRQEGSLEAVHARLVEFHS